MKKLLIMVTVFMMITSSLVLNASEGLSTKGDQGTSGNGEQTRILSQTTNQLKVNNQEQMQLKYNNFLSDVTQRQDARYDAFSTKWTTQQAKRDEADANFLKLVEQYAPEMLTPYETAFASHESTHVALFNTRTDIYTTFTAETNAALQLLKTDIDAKLVAKEITLKEAREMIKSFLDGRKAEMKTNADAYKNAIEAEKAAQEIRVQEVKAIRAELKAAIEASNSATITSSIQSLYSYLLEHIAFDEFKLTTMQSIF